MKSLQMTAIAIAIGLVVSAGVSAQALTKDQYKAGEARIAEQYTADKVKCEALSGNAKDICFAQAQGKEKVAEAELEASYESTAKHRYDLLVTKAKADYAIANQKCDDRTGNDQEVCVKEAKAVETRIRADAEAQLKIWEADQTAIEKTAATETKAKEEGTAARQNATAEKREANYAVAQAKCGALTGADSDRCLQDAKTKYGM